MKTIRSSFGWSKLLLKKRSRWTCSLDWVHGDAPVVVGVRGLALHASVQNRIGIFQQRHAEINNELNSGKVLSANRITELSIELGEVDPLMYVIEELMAKKKEVEDLQEIINESVEESDHAESSSELRSLAISERTELNDQIECLEKTITRMLLPKDKADDKSAIVEIRAGTGGEEASLFAMDMFRMYQKFALLKGWKSEVLSLSASDMGGCKEAVLLIKGQGVFGRLKFESGVHRVQRVPVNDVRVHTSAMSVAVLPEMEEVDVKMEPSDLRIDVYRSSGAGGQHVNTTESAVRITHLPTGLVAAVQDERSQHMNRAKAMKILLARIYDAEQQRIRKDRAHLRSQQIGSGDRSERIRTYNFSQNRISDHRINLTTHGMEKMLNGELLDDIIDGLVLHHQNELLKDMNNNKNSAAISSTKE